MGTAGGQPRVWVIRHGETDWSRSGQHTSRTDLPLTADGEAQARAVGSLVRSLAGASVVGALAPAGAVAPAGADRFGLVLCSPMVRSRRTAELAGLCEGEAKCEIAPDLCEWDYGDLEGRVTPEIRAQYPGWSVWDGPWPGGETAADVSARADRVLDRIVSSGVPDVAVVGHGHFSRVLAARWVGAEIGMGRWLDLDTASVSELGWSRSNRVIRRWNVVPVAA